MASARTVYLTLFVVCFYVDIATCFTPTQFHSLISPRSSTHQHIMVNATRQVATELMSKYPAHYPDQAKTLRSGSFKQALDDLKDGVVSPDLVESSVAEAHFDDELIHAGSVRVIDLREQAVKLFLGSADRSPELVENARELAGRALHGLQDFYSHSNWIEMNNSVPYPGMGETPISQDVVARPDQPTCVDCGDSGCYGNIILSDNHTLTTGYYEPMTGVLSKNNKVKLPGKCSHGGAIIDASSFRSPKGGINKDSLSDTMSPHFYLHKKAVDVATQSTVKFLEKIQSDLLKTNFSRFAEEDFAEFLGIPVGSGTSMCFIIDTSRSMLDDIPAVVGGLIEIMWSSIRSTHRLIPTDFVLSTFNSRGNAMLIKMTDPSKMMLKLSSLIAILEDSEREPVYHGVLQAIENVRPGSTCTLFTDAPPNDDYLYPTVLTIALKNNIKVNSFLSMSPFSRTLLVAQPKRKTSTFYDNLSRLTGGSVVSAGIADIAKAIKAFNVFDETSDVVVFAADNVVSGFSFCVDITMSDVVVKVSGASSVLQSVTFTSPDGSPFTGYSVTLNLDTMKIFKLNSAVPGRWRVNVSSSDRSLSAVVAASSVISFSYRFIADAETVANGYEVVQSKPLAGTEYLTLATVHGAFEPITGLPNGYLSNITAILFVNQTGHTVKRLEATETDALKLYAATLALPNTDFRVAVEGRDSDDNIMQRFHQLPVSPAVISLQIAAEVSRWFSASPGSSVTVIVNVTNVGDSITWNIWVSDTGNFYNGTKTIAVSLKEGESSLIPLRFQVPYNVTSGFISTVTINAGTSTAPRIDNYLVFYITVLMAGEDSTPPSCVVRHMQGSCRPTYTGVQETCQMDTWNATFDVSDAGRGLARIQAVSLSTDYSLEPYHVTYGTLDAITGVYESSCCHRSAFISVTDVAFNTAECLLVANTNSEF